MTGTALQPSIFIAVPLMSKNRTARVFVQSLFDPQVAIGKR
jgi:hypothetical protein